MGQTESSYRYTARNGNCQFSRSRVAARVSNYRSVGRGSEYSMQNYVGSTGPLSVCVDANSWNSYRGGIMTSCGNSVDHCVQVVGYGRLAPRTTGRYETVGAAAGVRADTCASQLAEICVRLTASLLLSACHQPWKPQWYDLSL